MKAVVNLKKLVIGLAAITAIAIITCKNPIMEKWWEDNDTNAKNPETEIVLITKMVPQVVYETIVEAVKEYEYVYEEIIVKIPEYIYESIIKYETIYETILINVPEYIYTIIVEYEKVYEVIYETLYDIIVRAPNEDEIKDYITNNVVEVINIIKDDPAYITIIKEIISSVPPEEIYLYLTDEQIRYVIQAQPPSVILQAVNIIDIEFIVFSGNTTSYNGTAPAGSTNLTAQERSSNDAILNGMAKALFQHPDYLIMLHGHANPTTFTDGETLELTQLSIDRANSVEAVLRTRFRSESGGTEIDSSRVTASGYGGSKNLFGANSSYAGLNRRVEMILVQIK
jgi:outer membrane protein OmpA-like peptidoglycan-associated protein